MGAETGFEQELFNKISNNDEAAFKILFQQYYDKLCQFASFYVARSIAEELVSDLFINLWKKRETLQVQSPKYYLFAAVKNKCINSLKKPLVKFLSVEEFNNDFTDSQNPLQLLLDKELGTKINTLIDQLPDKMRMVFILNRIDGLKYKEIATLLNISKRTVEDAAPDLDLNEVVWKSVKGEDTVMPAPRRSAFVKLEQKRKDDDD